MAFTAEIEAFIRDIVKDLGENSAAIFAGAGMSKAVGYVDWPELLREIADEIGLDIELEHDLISMQTNIEVPPVCAMSDCMT
jgi:hypothetical protein